MPKGKGYENQSKTGHLATTSRNTTSRTGGSDGTEGGQKKVGHLGGSGGGGIARPSGKEPLKETQGRTGVTTGSGGGRRKGAGESNPSRTDEISDIG